MISFVNAKINIGLNITEKRTDGYHNLESLFYPVGLHNGTPGNPQPFDDIIEIHLHDDNREDEFYFSGNFIDCGSQDNLVVMAVKKFRENALAKGFTLNGVRLHLQKHIPDGAGLGGGSADASFTMKLLNSLSGNIFDNSELLALTATLGADCPFFIINRPSIVSGLGDIIEPAEECSLDGYWCLIVKPDIYISTRQAFAGIRPSRWELQLEEIIKLPVKEWEEAGLKNDFEKSIFPVFPLLNAIKNTIRELGAEFTSMSGSGSSIFGLFNDKLAAIKAEEEVSKVFAPHVSVFNCKL